MGNLLWVVPPAKPQRGPLAGVITAVQHGRGARAGVTATARGPRPACGTPQGAAGRGGPARQRAITGVGRAAQHRPGGGQITSPQPFECLVGVLERLLGRRVRQRRPKGHGVADRSGHERRVLVPVSAGRFYRRHDGLADRRAVLGLVQKAGQEGRAREPNAGRRQGLRMRSPICARRGHPQGLPVPLARTPAGGMPQERRPRHRTPRPRGRERWPQKAGRARSTLWPRATDLPASAYPLLGVSARDRSTWPGQLPIPWSDTFLIIFSIFRSFVPRSS